MVPGAICDDEGAAGCWARTAMGANAMMTASKVLFIRSLKRGRYVGLRNAWCQPKSSTADGKQRRRAGVPKARAFRVLGWKKRNELAQTGRSGNDAYRMKSPGGATHCLLPTPKITFTSFS